MEIKSKMLWDLGFLGTFVGTSLINYFVTFNWGYALDITKYNQMLQALVFIAASEHL